MSATTPLGQGHEREPLVQYAALVGTFLACAGGAIAQSPLLRAPVAPTDIAILGLACARLARLVTKDKVTRLVRAPFTDVVPGAKPTEVAERPRQDHPVLRVVGELVTCPWCVGVWAGTALAVSFARWPRATRAVALGLASSAISDFYCAAIAGGKKA